MIKQLILAAGMFVFLAAGSACTQCKQCSGESVTEIFIDGVSQGTQTATVSAVEYCGDELDVIESNPEVVTEVDQDVLGISQTVKSTTTYTCE